MYKIHGPQNKYLQTFYLCSAGLCVCLFILFISGCGTHEDVLIQVNLNGIPYTGGEGGRVGFISTADKNITGSGILSSHGKCFIRTAQGNKMPPGEYIATVAVYKRLGSVSASNPTPEPELISPARYASLETSGLIVTLKPKLKMITLDLETPEFQNGSESSPEPDKGTK